MTSRYMKQQHTMRALAASPPSLKHPFFPRSFFLTRSVLRTITTTQLRAWPAEALQMPNDFHRCNYQYSSSFSCCCCCCKKQRQKAQLFPTSKHVRPNHLESFQLELIVVRWGASRGLTEIFVFVSHHSARGTSRGAIRYRERRSIKLRGRRVPSLYALLTLRYLFVGDETKHTEIPRYRFSSVCKVGEIVMR